MKACFHFAIRCFLPLKTAAFGLGVALLLAGCTKKVDGPAPVVPIGSSSGSLSTVSALVSGAASFSASGFNDIDGLYYTDSDPANSPARLVLRARSGVRSITFSLIKFTGPGTYTLMADPNANIGTGIGSYSENSNANVYFTQYQTPAGSIQGRVVVTAFDKATKHLQGTFYFGGIATSGSTKGQMRQLSDGKLDVYDVFLY